jgi:lipoprotein-anchoring transpeptidase ErfK/SrfK
MMRLPNKLKSGELFASTGVNLYQWGAMLLLRDIFMRLVHLTVPLLLLDACNMRDAETPKVKGKTSASQSSASAVPVVRDVLSARDPVKGDLQTNVMPDSEVRPLMQAQVVLDRLGFTPGVVDGKSGLSTRNAIAGFQEANNLAVTGELDDPTIKVLSQWNNIAATRVVTIPADFSSGPYFAIPKGAAEQAKMSALNYESLDEKLAERFHTTVATLQMLNPNGNPAVKMLPGSAAASPTPSAMASVTSSASPTDSASGMVPGPVSTFHPGQQIRVPNVGGDAISDGVVDDAAWLGTLEMLGVGTDQPKAARIVVSKSKGTLKAFDEGGKLVAVYTATMGSTHDPLPVGQWKIEAISRNPKFHYNPALFWDAKPGSEKALLPAGPNGPVGVVWIALSKPHYGIHGTPHPETIGRAESHGCVRLTNWDAARLAQMVSTRTKVEFNL